MHGICSRIQEWGGKYGWGVVVSAAPYANGAAALTAGLGFFLLMLFFSLFNVYPAPPSETGNPFAWALYLLGWSCYAWMIWSYLIAFVIIPLGAAVSFVDLLAANATKNSDRMAGAVAGLSLTIPPLICWYFYGTGPNMLDSLHTLFPHVN